MGILKQRAIPVVRKNTIVFVLSLFVLLIAGLSLSFRAETNPVDKLYMKELANTKAKLKNLKKAILQQGKLPFLKSQFKQVRISYKKNSVLIDFFNAHDAKKINGPTIDHIEDDNPDKILHPQGLQVIEALLFDNSWNKKSANEALNEIDASISIIEKLETEFDRPLKFRKELVFSAIQMWNL